MTDKNTTHLKRVIMGARHNLEVAITSGHPQPILTAIACVGQAQAFAKASGNSDRSELAVKLAEARDRLTKLGVGSLRAGVRGPVLGTVRKAEQDLALALDQIQEQQAKAKKKHWWKPW